MAVHIYGESMYPDIPNGSVCFVRRVTGRIIDWGRAYILDTVDGPVLKYLTPGSDDEHIRCVSANHDPKFAPFEVQKEDILGMYKVVMCMKMM
jgi:phage repressor protein C with HTH and peptisase S24 domain